MTDALPPGPALADQFDLLIIGGGINGVGIARDAAGRGLKVLLCERGDLGQGTSSAATKLVHGGLRYLEFYEFRLGRGRDEREVLLRAAPNIAWPMEFVLPDTGRFKPSLWMRVGLFVHDYLSGRKRLGKSYQLDLSTSRFGKALKPFVKRGFVYSDAWVEESRLVALTALDAAQHGAEICLRTDFLGAQHDGVGWRAVIQPQNGPASGVERTIQARQIVNAAGSGLDKVAALIEGNPSAPVPARWVKGSHIIVPRLYEGEHGFVLQHPDRRMVFVIPFENRFTLIGTTDHSALSDQGMASRIRDFEIKYLLEAVNLYFKKPVAATDVRHSYSGARPLFEIVDDKGQRRFSDYRLVLEDNCLSVFGGKTTTYRHLAEEAVDTLLALRNETRAPWTHEAVLPGSDIGGSVDDFIRDVRTQYPYLSASLSARLAVTYGTRVHDLLRGAKTMADLGEMFGSSLSVREVDFLCAHEWATTPDDILLRRTKLGLHVDDAAWDKLGAYLAARNG